MKIRIYDNVYPEICKDNLSYFEVTIKGKLGIYFDIPRDHDDLHHYTGPETRIFDCHYDNTYKNLFQDLNFNYKFKFKALSEEVGGDEGQYVFTDCGYLQNKEGFAYLNIFQRFKIEWIFRRIWLQKSENIKWLISIPISILTTLIVNYLID